MVFHPTRIALLSSNNQLIMQVLELKYPESAAVNLFFNNVFGSGRKRKEKLGKD